MNILFFDSIDTDIFGGLENWIGIIASNFVERGHDITVAGRPQSEFLRRIAALDKRIKILEVNISGDFNPLTINTIKNYLKENNIEITVVNFNKDIRLAGLASRWKGDTRIIWRVGLDITKNTFIHRTLTPKLLDGVITPSHSLKQEITHFGYIKDDMVKVIHNGTTLKDFPRPNPGSAKKLREKYKLPAKSRIAVTVGRFVNHKGHIFLINAAPDIVKAHPDIVFMFLGDGYMQQDHEKHIKDLNLEKHFVFTGMLDNLDLELGADMVVHPSIIEPFSNAVLECMRAGLPIVASRVGGMAEAIIDGESGILVPPQSSIHLSRAIIGMLNDPPAMLEMGKSAQKRWRENFTIDIMVDKVEQHLKSFLN